MIPSDMNLKIRSGTAGYNNKILVSDGNFSLEKNENVNALVLEPVIPVPNGHPSHGAVQRPQALSVHKAVVQQTHAHELAKKPTHEDEKIVLVLALTGGFVIWNLFR